LSETLSRRRSGTLRGRAAWLGAVATLVAGLALAAAPAPPARAPAATQGDCQNLLKQFDVAWPAHRVSAHAESAHRNRDLGESDCRDGHYTDGVYKLRRALHDIGVKPVKNASLAPQH
jgi:hypothetical protein